MNDLITLVTFWEQRGLLDGLDDIQKIRMSMKFEILARHLLNLIEEPDYTQNYGNIEDLIFPALRNMCAERNDDGIYTFYGGVNPIRLLEEFRFWWNGRGSLDARAALRSDLTFYGQAEELLSVYCGMAAYLIRSDNQKEIYEEPIKPLKYIKRFRL